MKMVNVIRLLMVTLFFSNFSANAQNWCGFDEIMKEQGSRDEIVNSTKRNSSNTAKLIPTIVHIIHTGEPYGSFPHIASENVYPAIDSLNAWMDLNNTDINFCLASVGPDEDPISPIQYHNFYNYYSGGTPP